jgi:predicted RNA-binding Zn ribbon-like protein
VVQAFVNTHHDLDRKLEERLVSAGALTEWLAEHGLLVPGAALGHAELRRALDVRDGLRAMLLANNGCACDDGAIERLNRILGGPGVFVQLHRDKAPDFGSVQAGLGGALALLATIVALAQLDGSWARLKACPGEHCGWAFYDHSRNQTGSWCSMSVCGSRAKARVYRRRHASNDHGS